MRNGPFEPHTDQFMIYQHPLFCSYNSN